jgi:purine-binding chemotaxis protein CheW
MRALRLSVGADSYAVPMEVAREVVAAPVLTPLPTAPSSVLGVCNLRGEIIPVFDTGVLLGLGPLPAFVSVAVVETVLGPAGLATSEIGESIELGAWAADTDGPGTAGAFTVGDGLAVLIDIEALLAPARVAR